MPVYYPSLVVNLRVRFDETLKISTIPDPIDQSGDIDAISGVSAPITRPLITQTGADELTQILNRVPKTAQVECPSYRQAGTFSLEFDWRELPIDPRLMRSIGVEIYAGTVTEENFATGMTSVEANGTRRSVLKVTDGAGMPRDDLMLLAGVVDNWSATHNDGGSVIKMDGRDLRGLLLDSPINPIVMGKFDLTKSIIGVVQAILGTHPANKFIKVLWHDNDWPNGVPPSPVDKGGLTRVRQGAGGGGSSIPSASDVPNYWDIITNYCFLVGAVPYFEGRNLRIRPAASLYDQSKPYFSEEYGAFHPPVRVDDQGNPFSIRKLIFGRNVKELAFERKYHGVKTPVIQVNSFDTSSPNRGQQKLLSARWPPADEKAALISGVAPSGEVSQTDVIQKTVEGIRDVGQLLTIAKNLYEEIGRGELGGKCSTGVLSSYKGSNSDPDICRVRVGDMVEFLFDTSNLGSKVPIVSTLNDGMRRSFDEQVAEVRQALSGKSNGGDENLARVIVASSRSMVIDMLRFFRVANVVFNWSMNQGLQTSFDFQNYFVARSAVTPQLGPNVGTASQVAATNDHVPGKHKTNPNPSRVPRSQRRVSAALIKAGALTILPSGASAADAVRSAPTPAEAIPTNFSRIPEGS